MLSRITTRRRNRRRGAPRSLVVRRVVATLLVAGAAVLMLRTPYASAPAQAASNTTAELPPGIPLVLQLADPATASVLKPGGSVDLYVAYGDQPPTLALIDVPLLDIQRNSSTTSHSTSTTYIVVHVSTERGNVIERLLSASAIVATVSAVQGD